MPGSFLFRVARIPHSGPKSCRVVDMCGGARSLRERHGTRSYLPQCADFVIPKPIVKAGQCGITARRSDAAARVSFSCLTSVSCKPVGSPLDDAGTVFENATSAVAAL